MKNSLTPDVGNKPVEQTTENPAVFNWKLWIYTNYDCHLRCSYCLAESSPEAERRAMRVLNK
jgi:sulfatase maturation enzyme AslB (radical SAM superfamily)